MRSENYGEPVVWEWNFDDPANPKATATFQCKNNNSAAEPERVTVDAEVTCNKADCVPNGKLVYTATVNGLDENGDPIVGTTYTDTEERTHAPEWVETESYETPTCKVDVYRCPYCGEGYMKITATVLDKDNKPVEGAKITINGVGVDYSINSVTPANGTFVDPDKLAIGEYEIEVSYINDLGEKCGIKGKLTNDEKASEFGTLAVAAKGADNFRCSMCPTYEKFKSVPIVDWIIALGKEPQEKLDDAVKDIIGK